MITSQAVSPSPWYVVQNGGQIDIHSAKYNDGGLSRELTVASDVRFADAALLAAAPELLAALKRLVASPDVNMESLSPETIVAADHARDAIRHAEGR